MIRVCSVLVILAVLFSCAPTLPIYQPNPRNVSMLSKAGEVQGQLLIGPGYSVQGVVAITNHIAALGNVMSINKTQGGLNEVTRHNFGEAGIGYYTNYGTDKKYYVDLFAGYGVGKIANTDSLFISLSISLKPSQYLLYLSSLNYHRYFLQPTFGVKAKHFQGAMAYRFSMMDFKTGVRGGKIVDLNQSPVFFIEPALVARFPFEKVVPSIQIGMTMPIDHAGQFFDYSPLVVTVGIGFRLGYQRTE